MTRPHWTVVLRRPAESIPDVPPGPDCLDHERSAALVEGALEATERVRATRHLSRCAYCRRAVASLARALGDPEVIAAAGRASGARTTRLAWATAAAAVLLVAVLTDHTAHGPTAPVHRGTPSAGVDQPVAISPLGPGERPSMLRWRGVAGADRYRITLFRSGGEALYEVELSDTLATLPASIRLESGRVYFWKVEARTGWGRWASSPLYRFSVGGVPTP